MPHQYKITIEQKIKAVGGAKSKSDSDKQKVQPPTTSKGDGNDDTNTSDLYKMFSKTTTTISKAIKNPIGTAFGVIGKGSIALLVAGMTYQLVNKTLEKTSEYIQLFTGNNQLAIGVRNAQSFINIIFNPIGAIFTGVERYGNIVRNNLEVEQRQIAVGTNPNGKGRFTI